MVDSGAETCVVSLGKLQQLGMTHKIVGDKANTKMMTADGAETGVRGTINLSYKLGGFKERRKFTVVDSCSHDFVLGMPFLQEHEPEMRYRNRTMTMGWFNQREGHPEYCTLQAVDTDVVPGADTCIKFMRLGEARRLCRKGRAMAVLVTIRADSRADRDQTDVEEGQHGPVSTDTNKTFAERGRQGSGGKCAPGVGATTTKVASLAASAAKTPAKSASQGVASYGLGDVEATTTTTIKRTANAAVSSPKFIGRETPRRRAGSDLEDDEVWAREVDGLVKEYPTVFLPPDGVINRPGFEHEIKLVEGAVPPKKNAYRMTPRMLAELRKQLKELLERGHIRPSNSPYGAPVIFVAKKDTDELRMCIDYRALNAITVKDSYPIPRIDQLTDIQVNSTCWSKMDMASAYNQFPVKEESVKLTAFVTRYGTFECTVMPFGLCNAPATCMRYMQHVLRDLLDTCVVVYLDDVLVHSPTREQHLTDLRNVMDRLQKADLRLKRKKCFFGVDQVEYLGFVISKQGISMDPKKVTAMLSWPRPKSVTDVRSFLGLVGYYRKFLKGFADVTAPLVELTKKNVPWDWDAAQEYAFKALKEMLTTAPTLLIPDTSAGKTFVIHTDASDYAVGAVLLQDQGNGGLQPCAYYSKKLNSAERNYSVGDKEMLAMKLALTEYRIYVEGVPTVLCTDHRNNVDLLTRPADKIVSRRVARYIEYMQQFGSNLTLAYVKGEENQADALSRRPDWEEIDGDDVAAEDASESDDDEDEGNAGAYGKSFAASSIFVRLETILAGTTATTTTTTTGRKQRQGNDSTGKKGEGKPKETNKFLLSSKPLLLASWNVREHLLDPENKQQLMPAIRCNVLRVTQPGQLERDIQQAYRRDPNYCTSTAEARQFRTNNNLRAFYGLWWKGERVAVPNDFAVRKAIIRLCHDGQAHIGENKVMAAMCLRFWWVEMLRDIRSYIKECAICVRAKTLTQKKYGVMFPIPIPSRAMAGLSMDLVHMPMSRDGKNMLWVAVCRRTKWVIVVACTVDIGTSAIIDMLRRYVMVPFGTTPEHIICDNDIRFTSNEFIRFCTDENIEVRYAATYHPQTDGQTERANLTICNMLRTKLENRAQDWTRYLPSVVKAYNGSIHASTKMSPFYAIYGRHPRQLIDVAVPQAFPVVSDPVRARNEAQVKLDANVARASAAQKRYFDRKRQELTMVPGDKVYVDARYLPKRATMTKMHHRREGPFRVTRVIGNGKAYVVDVPYGYDNMRGVTFSTDKLVPYRESLRWGLDRRNGAGRTEWDDDALPERILGHFQRQGETKRYLVRYRGHHPGLDQWVPGRYLPRSIVRAYWRSGAGVVEMDPVG